MTEEAGQVRSRARKIAGEKLIFLLNVVGIYTEIIKILPSRGETGVKNC
jgi:hypothetical protein